MGIRTPVSHNWAMTLGGLKQGVTPLDMAHAYQTFARKGKLVYGTLSPGKLGRKRPVPGPVGIRAIRRKEDDKLKAIELPNGEPARNEVKTHRVLDESVANTVDTILQGVVKNGTGKRALLDPRIPVAGKTGTTENYGDAWFVGFTPEYTVAVWVGYPKKFQPMKTEFQGQPVAGGTFPAGIWKTFMQAVIKIDPPPELKEKDPEDVAPGATAVPGAAATVAPAAPGDAADRGARRRQGGGTDGGTTSPKQPQNPTPKQPTTPAAGRAGADRRAARQRRRDAAVGRHRRGAAHRPAARPRGASVSRRPLRPRPADRARARRAEAPRQLGRLGDADARADEQLRRLASPAAAARCAIGPPSRSEPLRSSSMSSACVSLPGPEQRSSSALHARAARASARAPRAAPARGSAPRRRRPRPRRRR